ncbi:HAMP domain-containing histidine kinase [Pseudomonas sp. CFBP 13711]|uniref:sensor histidine kinase n=1 Tax=unclassified Pseudomonas TaxID=196821 RepID=UPI0017859D7A|nr:MULTISPECIES: HAMP domain-containing sensor histidine kinase [unclassified Pseudomonas]MBD8709622.1 HAMP domain-containing histidine kinase [Pseudomonas sp. CFBP 13711]MBD8714658.1 HAMP domain-containing histidine kinase [Pseudomonas sp. CFBP 13715]
MPNSSFAIDVASIKQMESIPLILRMVKATTGLRFAAVARVTESRWIACAVDDDAGLELDVGSERVSAQTLCDQVRRMRRSLVYGEGFYELTRSDYPVCAPSDIPSAQSHISIPIITADGQFFGTLCALDTASVVLNEQNVVTTLELFAQLIASNLDLHDRLRRSESQLGESIEIGRLREQFVAVLSHDLRTPLSAVRLSADALHGDVSENRRRVLADAIRTSAARMSALIEDVLDFTRCQLGGDVSIKPRRVADIFGALEPVVQEVRLANPQANIVFQHTGAATLLCDPGRIKQLLSNLAANAVAHGLKGGPILIKGQVNQSTLQLTCTNVGQPIPESLLGSLFEPFTRTKHDSPSEGLGLGLYICSQIAKAHGGTLSVCSSEQATTFSVTLPIRS